MNEAATITPQAGYRSKVEHFAAALASQPQVECKWTHRFAPGLYIREIFMPAGSTIISRKHLTEHPYVITKGRVAVMTENGVQHIQAPYWGITKAGTQRVLHVHEDCTWLTFHLTDETNPEKIVQTITEKPPFEAGEVPPIVDAETLKLLTAHEKPT